MTTPDFDSPILDTHAQRIHSYLLAEGPSTTTQIADALDIPTGTIPTVVTGTTRPEHRLLFRTTIKGRTRIIDADNRVTWADVTAWRATTQRATP